MPNQETVRRGQKITIHKHGLGFEADVTEVNEDGTINAMAMSKFGHLFPCSRVSKAVILPVPDDADNIAYWTDAT